MTLDGEQRNLNAHTLAHTHPQQWIKDKDITLVVLCCLSSPPGTFLFLTLHCACRTLCLVKISTCSFPPLFSTSRDLTISQSDAEKWIRSWWGGRPIMWEGNCVGERRCCWALGVTWDLASSCWSLCCRCQTGEGIRHSTVICLFIDHLIVSLE